MSLWSFLSVVHAVGLALAMGAATVKVSLLLRSRADPAFTRTYLAVVRPITRHIIFGMILLTASGIGWLVLGYPISPRLIVKLVLVGAVWVMGPVIDNVLEPRFRALVPEAGSPASPAFARAHAQYLAVEIAATLAFYAIVTFWLAG